MLKGKAAMKKFKLLSSVAALAIIGLLAATTPGSAQTARDLTPEQTQFYQMGQSKPGSLTILTLLDRADATYGAGENVRLTVKSNEDAYITVLNIGASGRVTQLFPNAIHSDNRIRAGEAMEIPSPTSGLQIKVTGPLGAELVKIIATSKPVRVIPEAQLTGTGVFRTLDGGFEALNRDLEVVSANPPPDMKVAFANQVIRTVPARIVSNQSNGMVILPVAPTVAQAQTFPLLLATDKTHYRVGERITMAVTTLQPCHLSVLDVDASGKTRQLFPTSALPSNQVGAMQTVLISGGPAPQTLVGIGPGAETIVALCTSEPRQIVTALKLVTDFLNADEKSVFERDLAAIPTHPAGTVGLAQVSINIVP
jgi:Domain of unknown function (DUF4384)